MCYKSYMDTTIRNLDDIAYRELKAHAALTGKTIGETVNEAMRAFLTRIPKPMKKRSLSELQPQDLGPGSERLSEEIDDIVYGS